MAKGIRQGDYSRDQIEWIREQYQALTLADLTRAYNDHWEEARTLGSLKSCLRNNNITCSGKAKGGRLKLMNDVQFEWLKGRYREVPLQQLVPEFNSRYQKSLRLGQLKSFMKNHGVLSGRSGQYVKGQQPPPGSGMKKGQTNSGSFAKGHTRSEQVPMYTERTDKDGYIWIKVPELDPHTNRPWRFRPKHQWLWEKEHGQLPDSKHVLLFLDGDRSNCTLENLEEIHRRQLSRLNHHDWSDTPSEFKPTLLATIKVEDTISQLTRQVGDGKQ